MPAVIALAYVSLLTLGLLDNIRGPFFPEILEDLQLSGTEGGAFFAVVSFLAFFGSWLCHRLVRGRNPIVIMAVVSFFFALGYMGISFSPDFLAMLFFCAIFGWAYGTLNVLQNVIVCDAASEDTRRRWLNGLQGMYGLAALLAPLAASSLRSAGLGWRTVFLMLSFLPLLVVVLAWIYRSKSRAQVAAGDEVSAKMLSAERWTCAGYAALLSLYLWGELSISTRLVLWLRTQQNFSPEAADAQLAIFFLTLLGGRFALAFIPLIGVSNWSILAVSAFCSSVLYLLGIIVSPYFVAFCGLTLAPFFPVIMDQAAIAFREKSAKAIGAIIAAGNLSIMCMHVTIGALSDLWSLSASLLCGPVALTLAGLALVWARWREQQALTE